MKVRVMNSKVLKRERVLILDRGGTKERVLILGRRVNELLIVISLYFLYFSFITSKKQLMKN